jgi:hypothetical protein
MLPQRCSDPREHGPHRVPARGTWTAFHCAGSLSRTDFERLLTEAFGCEAA